MSRTKKIKTRKIDGMEISEESYRLYISLSKEMRAGWKSTYEDRVQPPFTEVYDSEGNLKRSLVNQPEFPKKSTQ